MSRSRKKHAITGVTTARSEKEDKRIINRILRRSARKLLKQEDREEAIFPIPDEVMSPWDMSKDGRIRWDKEEKPSCLNCLEKMSCLVDETYKDGCKQWRRYQWYLKALRK